MPFRKLTVLYGKFTTSNNHSRTNVIFKAFDLYKILQVNIESWVQLFFFCLELITLRCDNRRLSYVYSFTDCHLVVKSRYKLLTTVHLFVINILTIDYWLYISYGLFTLYYWSLSRLTTVVTTFTTSAWDIEVGLFTNVTCSLSNSMPSGTHTRLCPT